MTEQELTELEAELAQVKAENKARLKSHRPGEAKELKARDKEGQRKVRDFSLHMRITPIQNLSVLPFTRNVITLAFNHKDLYKRGAHICHVPFLIGYEL